MINKKDLLTEIIRLSSELNSLQDMDILLEKILFEARRFANADAGTIYIKNRDHLVFSHTQNDTLQKKLPPGGKLIYSTFSVPINLGSIAGYVAETGNIQNIEDVYTLPDGVTYRFDPFFDKAASYKTKSMLTIPLQTESGKIIGVLQIINSKDEKGNTKSFSKNDIMIVTHFANAASMVLRRAQMTRALLLRMMQMAQLRDPKETGAHVNRVAAYSVEIYEQWARIKNFSKSEIDKNRDTLRRAALLHDVGKVAISDLILKKPGKLDKDEYEIMKTHTYLGARLFSDSQSTFDEAAAEVSLNHHENWDGTGYPGFIDIETGKPTDVDKAGNVISKKGEEIPIFGRIVALADVYDALSSARVYKNSWKEKKVLEEIKNLSGKKFDPDLVDVFFDNLDIIRSISSRYPDSK